MFTRLGSLIKSLKFLTIKTKLPEVKPQKKEKQNLKKKYSGSSSPNIAQVLIEA